MAYKELVYPETCNVQYYYPWPLTGPGGVGQSFDPEFRLRPCCFRLAIPCHWDTVSQSCFQVFSSSSIRLVYEPWPHAPHSI